MKRRPAYTLLMNRTLPRTNEQNSLEYFDRTLLWRGGKLSHSSSTEYCPRNMYKTLWNTSVKHPIWRGGQLSHSSRREHCPEQMYRNLGTLIYNTLFEEECSNIPHEQNTTQNTCTEHFGILIYNTPFEESSSSHIPLQNTETLVNIIHELSTSQNICIRYKIQRIVFLLNPAQLKGKASVVNM